MQIRRFLLKTLVFVIVLVTINRSLGLLFSKGWENPIYFKKREVFLNDYAAHCNTIFYGSSRTYSHIDPVMFDSLNALSALHTDSYMLGTSSVFFNELLYQIDALFKDSRAPKNLKYLFVELDDYLRLTERNLYTPRASYYITPHTIVRFLRTFYADEPNVKSILKQTTYYLSSMVVNFAQSGFGRSKLDQLINPLLEPQEDSWILRRGHFALSIDRPEHRQSGYIERYNALRADTTALQKALDLIKSLDSGINRQSSINPLVLNGYRNLISDFKSRGVHVVVVLPMRNGVDGKLKTLYDALPEGHKIDMSSVATQIPELHTMSQWFDIGHLNIHGVRFYTQSFAQEVQKLNKNLSTQIN